MANKKKKNILTVEDIKFINIYNDEERFRTIVDVAEHLDKSKTTVGVMTKRLNDMRDKGIEVPEFTRSKGRKKTPVSEDITKYKHKFSKQDCIDELRRIVMIDTDKIITRNYFRVNSNISESTWNRHFGTFNEFKKQANVTLTRQQIKLERDIAKHASVEHYKEMSERRMDYGDRYIKENNKSFKSILIASDLHDIEVDRFWLRTFIDTAKRVQPDIIVLGGDVFDLPEFGLYTVDPREWDVVGRIKFVHKHILEPLREVCPDTQIDLIEGNHESRMLRHLADQTPAMRVLLSDLHGFTVSTLLGLDEYEVNYVARCDLSTFTKGNEKKELTKNYKIYYDSMLVHHFPHGRQMSMPGVNGHHHRHFVWSEYNPMYGSYQWHQLGGGHRREASYCEAEKWNSGFIIANIHVPTKCVNFDYVDVTDFAVVGGKWYYRDNGEE